MTTDKTALSLAAILGAPPRDWSWRLMACCAPLRAFGAWRLQRRGQAARRRGDFKQAEVWLAESARLLQRGDDPVALAWSLGELGEVARQLADFDRAEQCHAAALDLYETHAVDTGIAHAWYNLGLVAASQAEWTQARGRFQASICIAREIDDQPTIAWSLYQVALMCRGLGEVERARRFAAESFATFRRIGVMTGANVTMTLLTELERPELATASPLAA